MELKDTAELPSVEPLKKLNQQFHEQLSQLRNAMRQQVDDGLVPVVVRLDSRLALVLGETRSVIDVNGAYYHQLKALAHIPLLLFLAAHNNLNLEPTRTGVTEALAELQSDMSLPSDILPYIQDAAAELFGSQHWPVLEFSAARQFNDALRPAFQALIALAARDEAEQTLRALRQFEAAVDDERLWQQAFYVVCAAHQPRYKQLGKLVFQRWVFEQTRSSATVEQRVLYGEALESVEAARELVVTRLVNSVVGDAFLHSPLSMNQDVLGEAGEIAVEHVFRAEAEG